MPARLGQQQPDGESTGRCFALPSRIGDSRLDVRQRDETESVLDLDEQCGLCAISRHGMARLATVAPCAKLIVAGVDVRSLSLAATSMSPILCVSFRHDVVWLTSGFECRVGAPTWSDMQSYWKPPVDALNQTEARELIVLKFLESCWRIRTRISARR
jgi:hypothetical protein